MKNAMEVVKLTTIDEDLISNISNSKKSVNLFIMDGINDDMPGCYVVIQEVPTRFGKTIYMIPRFLRAGAEATRVIENHRENLDSALQESEFYGVLKPDSEGGRITYPVLRAIVQWFVSLVHVQTSL